MRFTRMSRTAGRSGGAAAGRFPGRIGRRAAVAATVVAAAAGVSACGSSSTSNNGHNVANSSDGTIVTGSLPPVGTAVKGGTLTVGQITGNTPTYIMPLNPGSACGTDDFQLFGSLYVPLYYGPKGASPQIDQSQSLASGLPTYTDNDKTVTINIKSGLKWSDGTPVTAKDVIFYMDLLTAAVKQSPSNWCQAAPNEFPTNVASYSAQGADTVVLHLKATVNPTWFTLNQLQDTNGGVYALPAQAWSKASANGPMLDSSNPSNALKIYEYLNKQGESVGTFGSNPLWQTVDGPYKLTSFSATNSSYVLSPNPDYGLSPKPSFDSVDFNTFTSSTAELNALESGSLDIGGLDVATQVGAIPTLKRDGFSVFGDPGWGWYGGFINYLDKTDDFGKVAAQAYMRGVFAELVNQPALIKGVYHGYAVPAYGPVATAPFSPYVPASATTNPWPYNPKQAAATLKAHGWDVKPGGTTTCAKAGTGADECGAGIPVGTPIKFVWANLPESTAATGVLETEQFASEAKAAAGIDVQLQTQTFTFLTANYDTQNPAAVKYNNDWGVNNYGGVFYDFYPTQNGILSVGAGFNYGSYNDATATKLMTASINSPSNSAILDEVKYLSKDYPLFWEPDPDQVSVISNKIGGPNHAFLELSAQLVPTQFMYQVKSK